MKNNLFAFISGFIFALGLGISQMTNPFKIIGFLDFFGNWDPSLLWVMAGAVLVYSIAFWLKKSKPICASEFQIPKNTKITQSLLFGSTLFGFGWGMAGFCPGPSITALASGSLAPIIFVSSMIVGMVIFTLMVKKKDLI